MSCEVMRCVRARVEQGRRQLCEEREGAIATRQKSIIYNGVQDHACPRPPRSSIAMLGHLVDYKQKPVPCHPLVLGTFGEGGGGSRKSGEEAYVVGLEGTCIT